MRQDTLKQALARIKAEMDAAGPAQAALKTSLQEKSSQFFHGALYRTQREPGLRELIDDVYHQWILTFRWPLTNPHYALFLHDRLCAGYKLGGLLYTHGFQAPAETEQDVLAFLLIESWPHIGFPLLRLQVFDAP